MDKKIEQLLDAIEDLIDVRIYMSNPSKYVTEDEIKAVHQHQREWVRVALMKVLEK